MANEEHLALLKQGVAAWNQWRQEHPEIRPDLDGVDLDGVDLTGADLTGADLFGAHLDKADLFGAHLTRADLTGADLLGANLGKVDLIETDLTQAFLYGANLSGANLLRANLAQASLIWANLTQASLIWATFAQSELSQATLAQATIGWTMFGDVNLGSVRGLETVRHNAPSTIGIDTLYRSHGNIPEVFLQGAGVPEELITYSKSLVSQPSQHDSCFISYSSRDKALAQRLRADLQVNGVRCWFAPEDLKIGDKFRSRIDESIQMYDRLLLMLSEHSVKSHWVQKEVETAFEKEVKENRIVLFPVRIDEAVMESSVGWAADIRRQRHIGDFRQWKDYDAYHKAFQHLLRDLKAGT